MNLYPIANKTNLVKMLRKKGQDIPSLRDAALSKVGRSYFLRWADTKGERHIAYYTAAGGRPVLQVDNDWLQISLVDMIHYKLVEEVHEK